MACQRVSFTLSRQVDLVVWRRARAFPAVTIATFRMTSPVITITRPKLATKTLIDDV